MVIDYLIGMLLSVLFSCYLIMIGLISKKLEQVDCVHCFAEHPVGYNAYTQHV